MNLLMKKRNLVYLLIFYVLFIYSINLSSQIKSIEIETGKYNSGKIGFVSDIFQDSRGFLWIATNDGLYKYDGYNYTQYEYSPEKQNSISSNLVKCIAEDKNGKLWIGTNYGLNCFDPETESFERFYANKNEKSINSNNIRKIIIDNNNIWIVSNYLGLNKINLKTKKIDSFPYLSKILPNSKENSFVDIVADSLGRFWIIGQGGLKSFDTNKETFKTYADQNIYQNSSNYYTGSCLSLSEDILWIGTFKNGIGQFNIKQEKYSLSNYQLRENQEIHNNQNFAVRSIYVDTD